MAISGAVLAAFFATKLLMVYDVASWLVPYIDPSIVSLMVRRK